VDLNYQFLDKMNNPKEEINILNINIENPIWLSVSESAKIAGVQAKTIRRAISSKKLVYKIVKDRYLIDLKSVIIFTKQTTKLNNKLNHFGIGQYIKEWE